MKMASAACGMACSVLLACDRTPYERVSMMESRREMRALVGIADVLQFENGTISSDADELAIRMVGRFQFSRRELLDHFGNPYRIAVSRGGKHISVISAGVDGDFATASDNMSVEEHFSDGGEVDHVENGFR